MKTTSTAKTLGTRVMKLRSGRHDIDCSNSTLFSPAPKETPTRKKLMKVAKSALRGTAKVFTKIKNNKSHYQDPEVESYKNQKSIPHLRKLPRGFNKAEEVVHEGPQASVHIRDILPGDEMPLLVQTEQDALAAFDFGFFESDDTFADFDGGPYCRISGEEDGKCHVRHDSAFTQHVVEECF